MSIPISDAARRWWRHGRGGLPAALAVGLCVLVLACGGGSGAAASPSTTGGSSTSEASGSSQTAFVAFAQCMRSHGVTDFPDPQNGRFIGSSDIQTNPNFNSAVQACQHLLPGGSANGGGASNSALVAFSHCMQNHGIPFPDPAANGGLNLPQGVDPNSPQFQAAFKACSSYLPDNGAGLGG